MLGKKRRIIRAAIAGVAVLGLAIAGYYGYDYYKDRKKSAQEQEQQNNDPFALQDNKHPTYQSEYPTTGDIEKIENPEERYNAFIRVAGSLYVERKSEESLKYSQKAFNVKEIDEKQRKLDLLNAYYIAQEAQLKSFEDDFYNKLGGQDGINNLTAGFPRESQTE